MRGQVTHGGFKACSMPTFAERPAHILGDELAALRVRVRQKQDELLAAVARGKIRGAADPGGEDPHERAQAGIAGLVAILVVELLEVIDVHQQ